MPAAWKATAPGVYSRNVTVFRSGRASLKFVNSDPKKYVMTTQWLHLKPGGIYDFKGWVKTKNVSGSTGGVTIGLESYRDKVYLGGTSSRRNQRDTGLEADCFPVQGTQRRHHRMLGLLCRPRRNRYGLVRRFEHHSAVVAPAAWHVIAPDVSGTTRRWGPLRPPPPRSERERIRT